MVVVCVEFAPVGLSQQRQQQQQQQRNLSANEASQSELARSLTFSLDDEVGSCAA